MSAQAKERPIVPEDRTGDPIFTERLRGRIESLGLSRKEVGESCNPPLDARTISTYVTGRRDVSTHYKRELARVLGTTVAYLVGETDNYRTPEAQLRALGIEPGNLQLVGDEAISESIVGLVQEMRRRVLRQPPPPQGGTPDADAGTDEAAGTGG